MLDNARIALIAGFVTVVTLSVALLLYDMCKSIKNSVHLFTSN